MEKKNIIVSDSYAISDKTMNKEKTQNPPIKGVISIYDKDGNLVKQVHNMVVNGGRYLLFGLFLNYALLADPDTIYDYGAIPDTELTLTNNASNTKTLKDFTNSKFSINFGYVTETVKTATKMNIDDVTAINNNSVKFELDAEDADSGVTVDVDPYDLKVTFKSTIHGSTNFQKFNQIYLTYNLCDKDTHEVLAGSENEFLFSRVIMDPVFIGADGEYSIHYALFF